MALRPDRDADARRRGEPLVRSAWSPWRRVTRPADLVAMRVSWLKLDLSPPSGGRRSAVLVASAGGGLLRFAFDFQHMAEQAYAETPPALFGAVPASIHVPVGARAAEPSRLVLAVPAGQSVEWSVEGLLDALGRLEMVVAPAALPASLPLIMVLGRRAVGAAMAETLERIELGRADRLPSMRSDLIEGQRAMVAANRMARGGLRAARDAVIAARDLHEAGDPARVDDATRPPTPGGGLRDPVRSTWTLPELRAPTAGETAIEAPFRLLLSPSARGGWTHARTPVEDERLQGRVELWHTRLGVRRTDGSVDEEAAAERIVRAIWTRDRDGQAELPFGNSLTASWRELIVRQSAGTELAPRVRPRPAQVRRMMLSSVGAWIDLKARWNPLPYVSPFGSITPLEGWEHVAPMGRDQYVRVDTPGYLFPLGHAATLVTITYRQIVGGTKPQAALFKKQYILLSQPDRAFARRDLPFVSARLSPDRTPDLDVQIKPVPYWPTPQGETEPFAWKIEALDQDGHPIHLQAPLLFVPLSGELDTSQPARDAIAALYAARHKDVASGIPAAAQQIAFAPALAAGEGRAEASATAEVERLLLGGLPRSSSAEPFLQGASIAIPAIQRLTPEAGVSEVVYAEPYKAAGFGAANAGNVYLQLAHFVSLTKPPQPQSANLRFGSSERAGGFIKPDVVVAGLARTTGLVGDVADAAAGTFDPAKLFASLPKLFGLYNLAELVLGGALDLAPKFVTQALDQVAGLLEDLARLQETAAEWGLEVPELPATFDELRAAIHALLEGEVTDEARQRLEDALDALPATLQAIALKEAEKAFEPVRRATIGRLVDAIEAVLANEVVKAVLAFAQGLASGGEIRARLDWRPVVHDLPSGSAPVLRFAEPTKALSVSVEARASGSAPAGLSVTAQLENFWFNLVPGFELMEVRFKRIAFVATAARRPEIDIVFDELRFVGVLSFVQVLKEMIPLDGFSDPPFLDVGTEGISAGFTLTLPNLAIGVFSLTNLSLGADARVPFLGNTPVSVGFNFCTRERPFTLAVAFLGGGGFLGIRLDPKGLVMLEGAFEFGAVVALDFGVASGSVSVMAGIYFKIEADAGQLTGYVRIRGEVDVLSLITASLELYLALTYYVAPQDKLIGEAKLTIKVEVLFFCTSVTVKTRRVFAGSNGDPTVRDMLLIEEHGDEVWNAYLAAFAGEAES